MGSELQLQLTFWEITGDFKSLPACRGLVYSYMAKATATIAEAASSTYLSGHTMPALAPKSKHFGFLSHGRPSRQDFCDTAIWLQSESAGLRPCCWVSRVRKVCAWSFSLAESPKLHAASWSSRAEGLLLRYDGQSSNIFCIGYCYAMLFIASRLWKRHIALRALKIASRRACGLCCRGRSGHKIQGQHHLYGISWLDSLAK